MGWFYVKYNVLGDDMYERIRDLREDKDLTQKQMAEILHCSQQVYSNYELGQRDIPTATLIALAQFHETTTDYILGLSDKKWYKQFIAVQCVPRLCFLSIGWQSSEICQLKR